MKLLICGGRDLDEEIAFDRISWFIVKWDDVWTEKGLCLIEKIIHGGAKGADTAAGRYARAFSIKEEIFLPDWERFGKSAGMIRNKKMLTEGQPDVILALPGGNGTKNMVALGEAAGIPIYRIGVNND
jgi:hypothetical protein